MAAYKDEQRGTWYVSFHYYDWTGKNCRKVKRGFKTKREATEWERHFRMKEAADLDMTFEEFVQAYTRDMKPKLKHNTWLTKEHILRTKLLPYFKDKKMRDIRPKDIIQWQNEQISYRDEKGKPYAPTYLKTLQSELRALFNHAVRFYELKSNPVVKAGPLGKGKAEEMLFWTKEEYLKFIEAVKDKPYSYHAFQILYWCGLRVGELLALTSQDIDFDNKVIRITKSYQRLEGKDVITDPKTPKSKRNVSMPDFLCEELKDYIGRLYGILPTDRIFHLTKSFLHHEMTRGAEKAGVNALESTICDILMYHCLSAWDFRRYQSETGWGMKAWILLIAMLICSRRNRHKWQNCWMKNLRRAQRNERHTQISDNQFPYLSQREGRNRSKDFHKWHEEKILFCPFLHL